MRLETTVVVSNSPDTISILHSHRQAVQVVSALLQLNRQQHRLEEWVPLACSKSSGMSLRALQPREQLAAAQQVGPAVPTFVLAPKHWIVVQTISELGATVDSSWFPFGAAAIVETPRGNIEFAGGDRFVLIGCAVHDQGSHWGLARKCPTAAEALAGVESDRPSLTRGSQSQDH